MAKDNAAAALAKKRWSNVSDEERKKLMSEAGKASWENATEEERQARGARLAEARAKKRANAKKKAGKKAGGK